jgi:hypothetical protein
VSASRSIIYAGADETASWPDSIRSAARSLRDEINAARWLTSDSSLQTG